VPRPRVLALEREMERLAGERGQHVAEIARAQKAIGETELDIVQLEKTRRETAETELRDVQAEIYDMAERRVVFEDQRQRTDIRAPQSGQVVGLSVHTTGAVITPGQKLMDIVPREDRLIVEARLRPEDVDKVLSGSPATVRFSAFDRDTTPELTGEVAVISGDRLTDPNTQESYYAVRVVIPATEIARLDGLQLRAGMPAEVFVQIGKRTALSYLVKPFTDALRRSFAET
jgi:HlyD family type I secretion membrane fusion protein